MTSSGEIDSAKTSIIKKLEDIKTAFDALVVKDSWQGDSAEQLKLKVGTFITEATNTITTKMDVLKQFAEKYEKFSELSKDTQSIRTGERDQHCKNSPQIENCHWTKVPIFNNMGNIVGYKWVWHACGPYSSAVHYISTNVETMSNIYSSAQLIKNSFNSTPLKQGEGTDASSVNFQDVL